MKVVGITINEKGQTVETIDVFDEPSKNFVVPMVISIAQTLLDTCPRNQKLADQLKWLADVDNKLRCFIEGTKEM
tara:strand:+ start:689 stop:913 length:225 start_codon:yes stop_codon:yes gene_type:complete